MPCGLPVSGEIRPPGRNDDRRSEASRATAPKAGVARKPFLSVPQVSALTCLLQEVFPDLRVL